MPVSEVECLNAWARLGHKGHRIVFLGVKGKVRQGAARSKSDGLGWVPVFLNGSGPSGRFIPRQPGQQAVDTITRHRQQAFLEVDLAERRVARSTGPTDLSPDLIVASAEELKKRERPYLQELLKETYAIYKNAWNELCREPSPLFLRAVFRKVFRPLSLTLIGDPGKPFELCPHLPADFALAYLASLIGRLPVRRRVDAFDYIWDELAEQIEAEVLKLEAAAEPSPRKEGTGAEPDQAQIPDKKKSRTGSKAQLRDDLIASVMRDNPDASDKELCEILDRKPLPVFDTWPEKTWLGNLLSDDPKVRSRVKKHLSGLRSELGLGKRTKSELTIELP